MRDHFPRFTIRKFRTLDWYGKRLSMNREYMNNFTVENNIILITGSVNEARQIQPELEQAMRSVGLEITVHSKKD